MICSEFDDKKDKDLGNERRRQMGWNCVELNTLVAQSSTLNHSLQRMADNIQAIIPQAASKCKEALYNMKVSNDPFGVTQE